MQRPKSEAQRGRAQYRRPMGRLFGWIVAIAGLLALVVAAKYVEQKEPAAPEDAGGFQFVVPAVLCKVERGTLQPSAELSAEVRSANRAGLSFSGSGRLDRVLVKEADRVQAGTLLAQLVAGDEEHELRRAKAALNSAKLEEKLMLAGEREEEKQRLLAVLDATRAEADLALLEVKRADKMVDERLIPLSEQDRRRASSNAAAKRSSAAEQNYQRALAGARPEDLAIARAHVDEAAARVAFAEHRLNETKLLAPWSGSIVQRMLSAGDFVQPGTPVFELVDLENLEIQIEVPGHYAGRLGGSSKARISLARRSDFELLRPLDAIVPAADPRARSFKAIVRLEGQADGAHVLKPGMSVKVELFLEPVKDALLVPSDSVLANDQGRFVVAAKRAEGGYRASFVPVIVLAEVAGVSAIESLGGPLLVGDELVLTGGDNAYPGATLVVQEQAAEPVQPSPPAAVPAEVEQ